MNVKLQDLDGNKCIWNLQKDPAEVAVGEVFNVTSVEDTEQGKPMQGEYVVIKKIEGGYKVGRRIPDKEHKWKL